MLLFYVNAVVFSCAFGVVDIVGRFLALELLARLTPPPEVAATVAFVFRLLAFPCLVMKAFSGRYYAHHPLDPVREGALAVRIGR